MINNLNPEIISVCIDMKKLLPQLAQVAAELNDYVKREETNVDTIQNIGNEYRLGITSGF
jgi:hypothetical protein